MFHFFKDLQRLFTSVSISDEETRLTVQEIFEKRNYLLDPHGAVGFLALSRYLQNFPGQQGMVLETAHPVKFYDVVEPVIGQQVPIPVSIQHQLTLEKKSTLIPADAAQLKSFLQGLG